MSCSPYSEEHHISKNLFVNQNCIRYKNKCFDSGYISHNEKEVFICHNSEFSTTIPFDEFKEIFENVEQLYRRIIFLRFDAPENA